MEQDGYAPTMLFRNLLQVGWGEMIRMLVAEPDMRDVCEILISKLSRRYVPPAIVEGGAVDPWVADQPNPITGSRVLGRNAALDHERSVIHPKDLHY